MVMKDRNGLSNKKLSKEVGFSVQLPKGDSTFLIEKMEGGERVRSVMRWFDKSGLVVECKDRPFAEGGANQFEWERNGTYYQMIVPDGKSDIAQKMMKDFH